MIATSETTVANGRRAPRWMWIVLVLSLALNLVIVGMAAAAMLHFRHGHGVGYFRSLPDDRRNVLVPILKEQRDATQPLRQAVREARRRAGEVLALEPYDRAKLAVAFEEVAATRRTLDKTRGEWLLKLADKMTAAERREYVEWRSRREHRSRRWRRRDGAE